MTQSRRRFARGVSFAVLGLLAVAFLGGAHVRASAASAPTHETTRPELAAEIAEAKRALGSSHEPKQILAYANLLYQSGEFWQAWDIVKPLAMDATASPETLTLGARLAYLLGHFDASETLHSRLIDALQEPAAKKAAINGLMLTYYQQNKFDAIKSLSLPPNVDRMMVDQAAAFKGAPYQLAWESNDKVSTIPMITVDPLPLVTIEVDGVPIIVLFDSGGDTLILDPDIAAALGIKALASSKGSFGGGKGAEITYGEVDRVKLGKVTMSNVPVWILPTKRFSPLYKDKGVILGGIIGTGVARQFLTTLDYRNKQIVLRERGPANAERYRQSQDPKRLAAIPFALDSTHLMMAKGGLNGIDGLTYFVDSGLAEDPGPASKRPSFTVPPQTLKYLGIPEPKRAIDPNSVGGGGGVWASGVFQAKSISLGPLMQTNPIGEFGSMTPSTYWSHGFIQDGLISHGFLSHYQSWTLDFDNRVFLIVR